MPKTVLQLIETGEVGGSEMVVLALCQQLRKTGVRPIAGLLAEGTWLHHQLRQAGIETIVFQNRYPCDPSFLWRLIRVILDYHVDVVHAHEFMMNVYGTLAARMTGRRSIATVHGKVYFWRKARRRVAYRMALKYATYFVAVSADLKQFVAQNLGVDAARIQVVYNGIDTTQFQNTRAQDARALLGFDVGTPVIGSVGNLYPVKGYSDLLKAAVKVTQALPQATFLIVGLFTEYTDQLKAEIAALHLENNVRLLGFREDIPALLSIMDLFVLPSLSEGLSLSVLQAMSSCKPVIVSGVGGNVEIIENEKTGILVPPQSSDLLAEKILFVLKEDDLARRMGEAARKRVEAAFSIEAMVQRYLQMYGIVPP